LSQSSIGYYTGAFSFNPVEGKPLYAIFSYPWAGLDGSGNPQGILQGKKTTDYASIFNSTDFSNLTYNGPANPVHFGSIRNTLSWKRFTFSANVSFKFGYFFHRPSINYSTLFSGPDNIGHPDYAKRWQKPGDEKITNVPSMIYPADANRDGFYNSAAILVDKGDHIRLQDLQLSYDLVRNSSVRLPVQAIRLYLYASNIGILWKANHDGIDPDYQPGYSFAVYPNPRSLAAGVKVDF
jgi:hypothetical protein